MANPFDDMAEMVSAINAAPQKELQPDFASNEAMIAIAADMARRGLIEQQVEELFPTWNVLCGNNQTALVVTPFVGPEENKDLVAAAMRLMLHQVNAKRYCFMSEAWLAVSRGQRPENQLPPSKRNDRIEVVIITAEDHEGSMMKPFEIIRDENGKVTDLKELDQHQGASAGGRFSGLLDNSDFIEPKVPETAH